VRPRSCIGTIGVTQQRITTDAKLRITRLGHADVLYRSPNDAWIWVDRWTGAPTSTNGYRRPGRVSVVAPM